MCIEYRYHQRTQFSIILKENYNQCSALRPVDPGAPIRPTLTSAVGANQPKLSSLSFNQPALIIASQRVV